MPHKRSEHTLGIVYLLLTTLCWSFVASTVKQLAATADTYTLSFFRVSLAALAFAILFMFNPVRR
ncbi:MAG: hypothetical protein JXA33_07200 [Anaerolineae bacterium]|nr:hypothetical protein [Anaerolineae bacterium]